MRGLLEGRYLSIVKVPLPFCVILGVPLVYQKKRLVSPHCKLSESAQYAYDCVVKDETMGKLWVNRVRGLLEKGYLSISGKVPLPFCVMQGVPPCIRKRGLFHLTVNSARAPSMHMSAL